MIANKMWQEKIQTDDAKNKIEKSRRETLEDYGLILEFINCHAGAIRTNPVVQIKANTKRNI